MFVKYSQGFVVMPGVWALWMNFRSLDTYTNPKNSSIPDCTFRLNFLGGNDELDENTLLKEGNILKTILTFSE